MQVHTKEFQDMQAQFEREFTAMPFYIPAKMEREQRTEQTPKNIWYTNSQINQIFIGCMHGYALAKCIYQTN